MRSAVWLCAAGAQSSFVLFKNGNFRCYLDDFATLDISDKSRKLNVETYRGPLQNSEDAAKWLQAFERETKTKFIVYKT